jgi:PAS domain-containing protein
MTHICGWCATEMGSPTHSNSTGAITQGVCQACMSRYLMKWSVRSRQREFQDFLDQLEAPVLVINSNGKVQTANTTALQMLGKEQPEIENRPGGEVFECIYAKEPEGCGGSVHCNGCSIRRHVMDTLHTGQPHHDSRVHLYQGTHQARKEVPINISTEKLSDFVLLRIDSMGEPK